MAEAKHAIAGITGSVKISTGRDQDRPRESTVTVLSASFFSELEDMVSLKKGTTRIQDEKRHQDSVPLG